MQRDPADPVIPGARAQQRFAMRHRLGEEIAAVTARPPIVDGLAEAQIPPVASLSS